MLLKLFRALGRYWTNNKVQERELMESDFTFMLNCLEMQTMKDSNSKSIAVYCATFLSLHDSLLMGSFDEVQELADQDAVQEGKGKRKITTIPTISPERSLLWLHSGLKTSFASDDFIHMFFDDLAKLVYNYAITPQNPFGVEVRITTDDSITTALSNLPPGYREVLLCLQNDINGTSCVDLFYYALDHAHEMGGPGSSVRLVIDMVESQLFSETAIATKVGLELKKKKDGSDVSIVNFMGDIVMESLGPYPFNMAFGPLLQHVMYLEATRQETACIDRFIDHCAGEQGFTADPIHRMGLLTMIGSFILNPRVALKNNRLDGLFCRSQIAEELVWRVYPVETLRRLLTVVCDLEDYDDFVVLVFAAAAGLIREHKAALVCPEALRRLYQVLQANGDDMKELLNDTADPECYENLLSVCSGVLGIPV